MWPWMFALFNRLFHYEVGQEGEEEKNTVQKVNGKCEPKYKTASTLPQLLAHICDLFSIGYSQIRLAWIN